MVETIFESFMFFLALIMMFLLGRQVRNQEITNAVGKSLDMAYDKAMKQPEEIKGYYASGASDMVEFIMKQLFRKQWNIER